MMHDYVKNFKKESAHLDEEVISAGESIIKAFENPNSLDTNHLMNARRALLDKTNNQTSTKARDNILQAILEEDYVEALSLIDKEIDADWERCGY